MEGTPGHIFVLIGAVTGNILLSAGVHMVQKSGHTPNSMCPKDQKYGRGGRAATRAVGRVPAVLSAFYPPSRHSSAFRSPRGIIGTTACKNRPFCGFLSAPSYHRTVLYDECMLFEYYGSTCTVFNTSTGTPVLVLVLSIVPYINSTVVGSTVP